MLRPFEEIRHPKVESQLIAADEEKATLVGGGKSYATPWHWHDCLMFMLPSQGAVELTSEGQTRGTWLSQDRFAVVPAGSPHTTRAGVGSNRHVAFYVTPNALERLAGELGSLADFRRRTRLPLQVRRSPALRALQDVALRADFGRIGSAAIRRDLSSALLVQCISDVISGEALSGASSDEHGMALVADVKAFLAANVDREIQLDILADRFSISRRHITRLFREGTGQSIAEFQAGLRLEQAARLLCETALPIGEIAFRVGFESGAALARAMRRVLGRSPSEIRLGMARMVKNEGPPGCGGKSRRD